MTDDDTSQADPADTFELLYNSMETALERLYTSMRAVTLQCPHGHPLDKADLRVSTAFADSADSTEDELANALANRDFPGWGDENIDGLPITVRDYLNIRCPRCPTYRGNFRLRKLADQIAQSAASGRRVYRLPG